MEMQIDLRPRRVAFVLSIGIAALVIVNIAAGVRQLLTGNEVPDLIDMALEMNIPTWYSSVLLLIAAGLLWVTARFRRASSDPYHRHWLGLALIFVFLSADESVGFHDHLNSTLGELWPEGPPGLPWLPWLSNRAWIWPAILGVGTLGMTYRSFLMALPRRTLGLFVLACGIFLGGAIGAETLAGWFIETRGGSALTAALTLLEETLEMTGVVVFVYALLDHLRATVPGMALSFGRPPDPGR